MAITEKVIKNVPQYQRDPETGEEDHSKTPKLVDEVEVTATGKDIQALKPAFDRAAWLKGNSQAAKRRRYGVTKVTDPNGRVEEIYSNEEEKYRQHGWCRHATRPTFSVGWGEQKLAGRFVRTKYKYVDGELVVVSREEK